MSSEQPPETTALDYESAEEEDWIEDDESEPPRRPRRRLLAPAPVALLAVLMLACGFLAGVLVQKGQGGTATAVSVPRSAAAVGGAGAARVRGGGGFPSAAGGAGFPGAGLGGGGASGRLTAGEVSFVEGSTLYVASSQGNTVKVHVGAGVRVTKTVTAKIASVHPGETVVVQASPGTGGTVTASSISVSAAGATNKGGAATSSSGGASGAGATTLFGSG